MDINCYLIESDGLKLDGICEEWFEVLWKNCFFSGDKFVISVPATAKNVELLKNGKAIELMRPHPISGTSEYGGIITAVELSEDKLTVKGQSFDGFLDRRVLTASIYNDTVMTVLRKNAGDLAAAKRQLTATSFNDDVDEASRYAVTLKFNKLSEFLNATAQNSGFSVHSRIIHKTGIKPYVEIYGRHLQDHSVGQDINCHVVFSDNFENAADLERTYNETGAVNAVFVGSKGKYNSEKHVDVDEFLASFSEKGSSGYERIEIFNEINPTTGTEIRGESGIAWEVLDYTSTYTEAEEIAVTSYAEATDCYSFSILLRDDWKARFEVGDFVTVEFRNYNLRFTSQITVIQEFFNADGLSITATLGEPPKKLLQILKRR